MCSIPKKLKSYYLQPNRGFSLVEVLLAVSIFGLIVTALVGGLVYGQQSTAIAGMRSRAAILADEGLEAVRNIRDENFSNLTDGAFGLTTAGNQWNLSGASDTTDIFTRIITISTVDSNRKQVTSSVSWQQNPQRTGLVQAVTYLTNWRVSTAPTSCNDYAVQQGYAGGTCRQNTQQCTNNGEIYLPAGDVYCTGGPSADTCCGLPGAGPTPTPTPTSAPASCASYCQGLGGYSAGTCRQNANQCTNNGETHESGGDIYCTSGPSADTCCCAP